MVDSYFTTYFGNLWVSQFATQDYESRGKEQLWKMAIGAFTEPDLVKAFEGMARGKFQFKDSLPKPGEFSAFVMSNRGAYYGPNFADKTKPQVRIAPIKASKETADRELDKIWKLLGYRD